VGDLARLDAGVTEVNSAILAKAGIVRGDKSILKVLGDGELNRAFTITAAKFSETAKAKIEKAGGQAIVA